MARPIALDEPMSSRWSSRVALFAAALLAAVFVLHRGLGLPTPIAGVLFAVVLALAGVALALASLAIVSIWRTGRPGAARCLVGAGLGGLLLMIPVMIWIAARPFPMLTDITTDPVLPPELQAIAALRKPGDNPTAYPGPQAAAAQARAYPDIRPMTILRSSDETFELVLEALKRQKMSVVRQDAPGPTRAEPGSIEAVDRTLVLGLYDDIAIRVTGDDTTSRVDMRSASRFGPTDLGRNAERLRQLAHEIEMRVDATVPAAGEEQDERAERKRGTKPGKEADRKQEPRRK